MTTPSTNIKGQISLQKLSNSQSQSTGSLQSTTVSLTNLDDQRLRLFEAVHENDIYKIERVVKTVKMHQNISDIVELENNMNALNFAIDHGKFDAAKYLIRISDDDMLLNDFTVEEQHATRTAIHQITISKLFKEEDEISIARMFLEKVNDKKQALMMETKYDVKSKRDRTFPCLHLAALLGKRQLAELYLETGKIYGLTVNQRNVKKDTALHWGARSGHSKIVEFLLKNDADPNLGNDKESTPLHWAVKYDDSKALEILLNCQKTDVNKVRSKGLPTPLIIASASGSIKKVKLLLNHKADVNLKTPHGIVPLHLAADKGHRNVVKTLLQNTADISIEDNNGDTAMTIAVRKGFADIVHLLLKWKDDPFKKNHMGHDAWHYAYKNDDDKVLMLLTGSLFPKSQSTNSIQDTYKESTLFRAASMGKCEQIKFILNNGISAQITDSEGNTIMHYAAENNQAEVIETFCKKCDVNIQNETKLTPFHLAVKLARTDSIRALLSVKARVDTKEKKGQTVIHFAAKYNLHSEIVRQLVEYTINIFSWDHLNALDEKGNNVLHVAAKYAQPDVLWELRYISFEFQNKKGNTPFHLAVRSENPEVLDTILDIFEVMLQKGNINKQNFKGETVLHLAVLAGLGNAVKRIIHLKGDLAATDINGDTPLHRLVKATVALTDLGHKQKCLETLDVIINECPKWMCHSSTFKNRGPSQFNERPNVWERYRRQSLTWLIHFLKNEEKLSVFTLCFSMGAHEFLSKILNLNSVKLFSHEGYFYNDITDIIHLSTGFLEEKYKPPTSEISNPKICGIEMLSYVKETSRVSKVLDLTPIKYMEWAYGKLTRYIFTTLLFLHFFYMGNISLVGMEISTLFRNVNYTFSPGFIQSLMFYVCTPLEPIVLIVFSIISIYSESAVHCRNFKKSMIPYYIIYIAYSFAVIIWMILVLIGERFQDYVLAVCLCGGWLYMIALTHVIRELHFFWRMLKYMVLKDIILFFMVYLIVLFAFTCAFHVLFQISSSISDMYEHREDTAFLVFTLMFGMGELFDENFTQEMKAVSKNAGLAKILFIGYVILATIILFNMLIAKMNDTYRKFSSRQKSLWRIDSILMGTRIERYLPLPLAKTLFRQLGIQLMEIPGEEEAFAVNGNIVRKYFLKRSKKEDTVKRRSTSFWKSMLKMFSHDISDDKENPVENIQEQVSKLSIKIDELSQKLDNLVKYMDKKTAKGDQESNSDTEQ